MGTARECSESEERGEEWEGSNTKGAHGPSVGERRQLALYERAQHNSIVTVMTLTVSATAGRSIIAG